MQKDVVAVKPFLFNVLVATTAAGPVEQGT
jgi:hypothetical protein